MCRQDGCASVRSCSNKPHSRSSQTQPIPSYYKSMKLTQFPANSQQSRLYQSAGSQVKSGSWQNPPSLGIRASHMATGRYSVWSSDSLCCPHGLDLLTGLNISSLHSEMGEWTRVGGTKPDGSYWAKGLRFLTQFKAYLKSKTLGYSGNLMVSCLEKLDSKLN